MADSDPEQRPLRLAVLISGGGTTLANLIDRIADGRLTGAEIRLVISSRSAVRGVDIGRAAGLAVEIIRKQDFADEAAFSHAISAALDRAQVDLVVMAGFLCLWRLPARYEGRVLNIHPGLLPNFCGQGMYGHHVHEAVLAAGERQSGCTVHVADNQYDHGPALARQVVPVLRDDTPASLAERVQAAERELYPAVIQQIADHGLAWLRQQVRSPAG
ncbi:MAG: phosphoribosylglycinamide formyltransferase [Planctomycetes bacterium]|nr:phosphoribosylglycinamide formyltransferase [Planctomycetota bacterium]